MSQLCAIITSDRPEHRNQALTDVCARLSFAELQGELLALEHFRHEQSNLYHRVRALFFLYAMHRFVLPPLYDSAQAAVIPYEGYVHVLN
ncbi:MAG: UTP--glucose-phosphate uridylyltransferase, partial [Chloroflexota bacterium]